MCACIVSKQMFLLWTVDLISKVKSDLSLRLVSLNLSGDSCVGRDYLIFVI